LHQLVHPASETLGYDDLDRSIAELFERVAARRPDKLALSDKARRLKFREAWQACLHLASRIAAVTPEGRPVGILMPSNALFPVCELACLVAGRPFVAIDPSYPAARNERICQQADLGAVVVHDAATDTSFLPDRVSRINVLDSLGATPADAPRSASGGPAAILFTSGSTGQPKGICYDQPSILERVVHATLAKKVSADDRVLLLSAPSTIAALRLPFVALLNGATLYFADVKDLGPRALFGYLREIRPTVTFAVPALLRSLLMLPGASDAFGSFRVIRTGGDVIRSSDLALWAKTLPAHCRVFVTLASTEAPAVFEWSVPRDWPCDGPRLPVGYPRASVQSAIVDDDGSPAARGEPGELIISSRYLPIGWWQEGKLHEGPFAPSPQEPGVRVFATRDLVRMRDDGLVEMIGRKDRQIKLRGLRIHLSDIEAALRELDTVSDVAVIARRDDQGEVQSLIAYVVPRAPASDDVARHIKSEVARHLPSHMRPSAIQFIDAIPMLPGWKPNTAELERMDRLRRDSECSTNSGE
jgi:non-ribosomal peptide synthetase component F